MSEATPSDCRRVGNKWLEFQDDRDAEVFVRREGALLLISCTRAGTIGPQAMSSSSGAAVRLADDKCKQ